MIKYVYILFYFHECTKFEWTISFKHTYKQLKQGSSKIHRNKYPSLEYFLVLKCFIRIIHSYKRLKFFNKTVLNFHQ